jgi:hypothetical protein
MSAPLVDSLITEPQPKPELKKPKKQGATGSKKDSKQKSAASKKMKHKQELSSTPQVRLV